MLALSVHERVRVEVDLFEMSRFDGAVGAESRVVVENSVEVAVPDSLYDSTTKKYSVLAVSPVTDVEVVLAWVVVTVWEYSPVVVPSLTMKLSSALVPLVVSVHDSVRDVERMDDAVTLVGASGLSEMVVVLAWVDVAEPAEFEATTTK